MPGYVAERPPTSSKDARQVRRLLVISLVGLVAQVALTDYGSSGAGAAVFWLLVGCVLLWMVAARRSRVARGLIVVTALLGAVVYGTVALGADARAALIAVACLGQAAPLLTAAVREHVRSTA